MAAGRSLHIRCGTWDQVEAFYQRKLRRGNMLSMKVPFSAEPGTAITLGLELPNQVMVAIDGKVLKSSPVDRSDRTWMEIELTGLTADLLGRLRAMVSDGRAGVTSQKAGDPVVDELPVDERQLFSHLSHELRRLRQLPVHQVLGVDGDADPGVVRRGWLELVSRYHPDVVAQHRSPAISHLAEEMLILVNRAYHRMRESLVAEGRATALGAGMVMPHGWLIGFDDLATGDREPGAELRARAKGQTTGAVRFAAKVTVDDEPPMAAAEGTGTGAGPAQQGGEAFEQRARALLATGDNPAAKEMLAAALCVYPRSRPLRSLYYVASALTALDAGHVMLATSQLEAALAHDEQCVEAAAILDQLRRDGASDHGQVRRLFQ
jgi:hypothetical protein